MGRSPHARAAHATPHDAPHATRHTTHTTNHTRVRAPLPGQTPSQTKDTPTQAQPVRHCSPNLRFICHPILSLILSQGSKARPSRERATTAHELKSLSWTGHPAPPPIRSNSLNSPSLCNGENKPNDPQGARVGWGSRAAASRTVTSVRSGEEFRECMSRAHRQCLLNLLDSAKTHNLSLWARVMWCGAAHLLRVRFRNAHEFMPCSARRKHRSVPNAHSQCPCTCDDPDVIKVYMVIRRHVHDHPCTTWERCKQYTRYRYTRSPIPFRAPAPQLLITFCRSPTCCVVLLDHTSVLCACVSFWSPSSPLLIHFLRVL